jgi:hypothetical protein
MYFILNIILFVHILLLLFYYLVFNFNYIIINIVFKIKYLKWLIKSKNINDITLNGIK